MMNRRIATAETTGTRTVLRRSRALAVGLSFAAALGGSLLFAPAANAATSCQNLSWDGNQTNDVAGTCWVDPGRSVTVQITCYNYPGGPAFTKTKTLGVSQSFVWNTGCHKPYYWGASLTSY